MSSHIGRVHGHRRPARGQRRAATTGHSPVGCIVTLSLALFLVPLAAEAQLPRIIPRIAISPLRLAPGPSAARHVGKVSGSWGMSRDRTSSLSTGGAGATSIGSMSMRPR
jgi:hypothetical protein